MKLATATTQLGTGSASESSYPDKRPGSATIRRPGQPYHKGHPTTSSSSAQRAHPPPESRTGPKTPPRLDLPGRALLPYRHHGTPRARSSRTSSRKAKEVHSRTPFYTRCRTLHNTLKQFPLLSLLVQSTDSCVKLSCHCHAACAYLLKFFFPALLLPEGTT